MNRIWTALLVAGAIAVPAAPLGAANGAVRQASGHAALTMHVVANGAALGLTKPDDLAMLGGNLFVNYQGSVGPSGAPAASGMADSVIVEYHRSGAIVHRWLVPGHCDGLTADPARGEVLLTVNEDGNSSMFGIHPGAPLTSQLVQYTYSPAILPHGGGTDAISIYDGQVLVSASAPSPAPRRVPAVYKVTFKDNVAQLSGLFSDRATATVANSGAGSRPTTLALTDPDSNAVVPPSSPRFAGAFVLDSQGDEEDIFLSHGHLSVLKLSQSVDDEAWVTVRTGTLYVADAKADKIYALAGPFVPGTAYVAVTPGDANNAPKNPPADTLGTLNIETGAVTSIPGLTLEPAGLLFTS